MSVVIAPANFCEYCKKKETNKNKLQICSKCNVTKYCNRDCQIKDWTKHKSICKSISSSKTSKDVSGNPIKDLLGKLYIDCCKGNLPGIQLYISMGVKINIKLCFENSEEGLVSCVEEESVTPLYETCAQGHNDCVEFLLLHGADPNILCTEKATPLHIASQEGHDKCIELLLQHGADPNLLFKGQTPLLIASRNGNCKCVELLLLHGADSSIPDEDQGTPLYIASHEGHDKCVALLLQHGADPNIADNVQRTPLYIASLNGNDKCVDLLLQHNADPNIATENGQTPLFIASQVGNLKCVSKLIEYGADINISTIDGMTALMGCALGGKIEVLSYLLSHGARIDVQNNDELTAVQLVYTHGRTDSLKKLIEHGADESSLQGLEFNSRDDNCPCCIDKWKGIRRSARYCEYPECSNDNNINTDEISTKKLLACTRCKLVHYCCIEHQRLHWKEHKKTCQELI